MAKALTKQGTHATLASNMELLLQRFAEKLNCMRGKMAAITIRRVPADEAGLAFALVEEYYQSIRVLIRETQREFFAEYFGDGRGLWLARAESELAGCVGLRKLPCPVANTGGAVKCAEIKRMYVREKFRGQGVAQKMLQAAESFARADACAWIYLDTTDEMTSAARLYGRNGYDRCARYNENPQATIFMRKSLRKNS
jgi:GNAT superfamily N-acetyltransferase